MPLQILPSHKGIKLDKLHNEIKGESAEVTQTTLDMFAMAALAPLVEQEDFLTVQQIDAIAANCYSIAHAMMRERAKHCPKPEAKATEIKPNGPVVWVRSGGNIGPNDNTHTTDETIARSWSSQGFTMRVAQ